MKAFEVRCQALKWGQRSSEVKLAVVLSQYQFLVWFFIIKDVTVGGRAWDSAVFATSLCFNSFKIKSWGFF